MSEESEQALEATDATLSTDHSLDEKSKKKKTRKKKKAGNKPTSDATEEPTVLPSTGESTEPTDPKSTTPSTSTTKPTEIPSSTCESTPPFPSSSEPPTEDTSVSTANDPSEESMPLPATTIDDESCALPATTIGQEESSREATVAEDRGPTVIKPNPKRGDWLVVTKLDDTDDDGSASGGITLSQLPVDGISPSTLLSGDGLFQPPPNTQQSGGVQPIPSLTLSLSLSDLMFREILSPHSACHQAFSFTQRVKVRMRYLDRCRCSRVDQFSSWGTRYLL